MNKAGWKGLQFVCLCKQRVMLSYGVMGVWTGDPGDKQAHHWPFFVCLNTDVIRPKQDFYGRPIELQRSNGIATLCCCYRLAGLELGFQPQASRQISAADCLGYPCQYCGRPFLSRTGRDQHIRLHTGKLLECSVCGKGYTGSSNLKYHMKSVHKMQ